MSQCQSCERHYQAGEIAIDDYGIIVCLACVEDNAAPHLVREYEDQRQQEQGPRRRHYWPRVGVN